MRSSLGSFLAFDRPGHRIYFDGKNDGFMELFPDMMEWDPGPSFVMGLA